jgi:hypothetical protein
LTSSHDPIISDRWRSPQANFNTRCDATFIGASEFKAFIRLNDSGIFRGLFPDRAFGDNGLEAPMLVEALSRALLQFNLRGKP